METLTLFIDHLYSESLGTSEMQLIESRDIISCNYENLTFSGSLYKEVVFEEVIFLNCTFMGTTLENCIFINCLFINCRFQFSRFTDCNFELTAWDNCTWGFAYEPVESNTPSISSMTLTMNELLNFCA